MVTKRNKVEATLIPPPTTKHIFHEVMGPDAMIFIF